MIAFRVKFLNVFHFYWTLLWQKYKYESYNNNKNQCDLINGIKVTQEVPFELDIDLLN